MVGASKLAGERRPRHRDLPVRAVPLGRSRGVGRAVRGRALRPDHPDGPQRGLLTRRKPHVKVISRVLAAVVIVTVATLGTAGAALAADKAGNRWERYWPPTPGGGDDGATSP